METTVFYIIAPLLSYFVGSIPFGYLVARMKGVDIRRHGSKNIGATNVGRVIGWRWFFFVFLLDAAKGFVPSVLTASYVGGFVWWDYAPPLPVILSGLATILGHTFPIFLRLRGGRAVATSCGVMMCLSPVGTAIALVVWVVTVAITKYISVGSMLAALALLISLMILRKDIFQQGLPLTLFAFLVATLVIYRHKPNVKRLIEGTESKIGRAKKTGNREVGR